MYNDALPFLFFGEEMFMAFQFFNKGYTLYAPNQVLVYHLWNRDYRPTIFSDSKAETSVPIDKELKTQHGTVIIVPIDAKYHSQPTAQEVLEQKAASCKFIATVLGMNGQKSNELVVFEQHLGIDFASRKIEEKAMFGGLSSKDVI